MSLITSSRLSILEAAHTDSLRSTSIRDRIMECSKRTEDTQIELRLLASRISYSKDWMITKPRSNSAKLISLRFKNPYHINTDTSCPFQWATRTILNPTIAPLLKI
jgi:hypothetical protein